jgi:type I restriction enzyme, S subunit
MRAMRRNTASGERWIVSMSDCAWRTVSLGSVVSRMGSGATPRGGRSVYTTAGVAFIRSQNAHDHRFVYDALARIDNDAAAALAGATVETGDVLINITGDSVARCCLAPATLGPVRVSQHVMLLRPVVGLIDARFLQGYLTTEATKRELLQASGAGATRPALTKTGMTKLPIRIPPSNSNWQSAKCSVRSATSCSATAK